ncbi:uncharacterized protein LOC142557223 [Dermacentor variabilis]|uniref:uncharacterized protein LOC142557223 n=1 Tax=Dermacentor variabilis TaxID=34621 RepID=UPI003F5C04A3
MVWPGCPDRGNCFVALANSEAPARVLPDIAGYLGMTSNSIQQTGLNTDTNESEGDLTDHCVPCTGDANQTCQIADKLSTWNRLLLASHFELREQADMSGQLCLVNFTGNVHLRQLPQNQDRLRWLLRTHHCIGSVHLKLSIVTNPDFYVLEALRHSSGIKAVKLDIQGHKALNAVSALIPSLTNIRTLHCEAHLSHEDSSEGFVAALSALQRASSSLESLHLNGFWVQGPAAETFAREFLSKSALKKLELQSCEFKCDSYSHALVEYLGTTTFLNAVTLDVVLNKVTQKAILEGLLKNRSIERLSIHEFIGDEEIAELVAWVISKNRVIRNLTLSTLVRHVPELPALYDRWLRAVIQNGTLEEVGLPLQIFHPSQWAAFIMALPQNGNLKKVHIDAGFNGELLRPVCSMLTATGSYKRVSIGTYEYRADVDLIRCKAFRAIYLSPLEPDDFLGVALHLLPRCEHVTVLSIRVDCGNRRLFMPLAEYLKCTTVLRELDLIVSYDVQLVEARGANPGWSVVRESLSRNKSLRKLILYHHSLTTRDMEGLADALKQSQSIRSAVLTNETVGDTTAFVRRLSKGIADNWTLLKVHCRAHVEADAAGDWLAVRETTLRNSGLVARAARIKKASDYDRYVTGALERVSRYPALLDEVAMKARIDKAELTVLVRDCLKRTESMDGFMRAAGVVRERVVCHPPPRDDCMQLDDLIEDCWRHVRRYLVIDDVKDSICRI